MGFFSIVPNLTYLAVTYCDGFTDEVIEWEKKKDLFSILFKVLNVLIERGKLNGCRAIDISNTVNLNVEAVHRLITLFPGISYRLEGLSYTGHVLITEQFWIDSIRYLHRIKSLNKI